MNAVRSITSQISQEKVHIQAAIDKQVGTDTTIFQSRYVYPEEVLKTATLLRPLASTGLLASALVWTLRQYKITGLRDAKTLLLSFEHLEDKQRILTTLTHAFNLHLSTRLTATATREIRALQKQVPLDQYAHVLSVFAKFEQDKDFSTLHATFLMLILEEPYTLIEKLKPFYRWFGKSPLLKIGSFNDHATGAKIVTKLTEFQLLYLLKHLPNTLMRDAKTLNALTQALQNHPDFSQLRNVPDYSWLQTAQKHDKFTYSTNDFAFALKELECYVSYTNFDLLLAECDRWLIKHKSHFSALQAFTAFETLKKHAKRLKTVPQIVAWSRMLHDHLRGYDYTQDQVNIIRQTLHVYANSPTNPNNCADEVRYICDLASSNWQKQSN